MIRICRRPSVFISLLASEPGLREANHAWLETAWLVEGARHRRLFSDRFETRCGGQGPVGGDPRWGAGYLETHDDLAGLLGSNESECQLSSEI